MSMSISMRVWVYKSEKKYWVEGIANKRNLDNIIETNNNSCVRPYTVIFSEVVGAL